MDKRRIKTNKRIMMVLALAMAAALLAAAPAQACACAPLAWKLPLSMTANPESVAVGEPVTFTITKTNVLPSALDWSVRDHLPAGLEFLSATASQGTCAPLEGSTVVQCDLGVISPGYSATMDVTAVPTVPGEITNYAVDTGENQASATVVVG